MVVGVIVLVSSSWDSYTPTGRMITVALPLVGLYLLSALTWGRAAYQTIAHYALLTSSAMLPFVAGVIIYQSGLYPEVDAQLAFYCSVVSLVGAGILEFLLRQREQVAFTMLSVIIGVGSLLSALELSSPNGAWLVLMVGILLLLGGISLLRDGEKLESTVFCGFGYMGLVAGLGLLPLSYATMPAVSELNSAYIISIGYAVVGLFLFLAAAVFGSFWVKNREDETLYNLRHMSESLSSVALTIPAIFMALSFEQASYTLCCILLGCISLVISYSVQVRSYRYLGYAAIGFGLLRIIFFALSSLEAFWPILLLITGFLFFLIAFAGTYLRKRNLFSALWSDAPTTMWGLGEPLPVSMHPPLPAYAPPASALDSNMNTAKHSDDWKWFLIVLGILIFLSFL